MCYKFLNSNNKIIASKDSNIFVAVIKCYIVKRPSQKEELSNKKVEVKQITDAEALRTIKKLKLWKL